MNVNPKERFQSAEKMRHALEQVELGINWSENLFTNGTRWNTVSYPFIYEVRRSKNKDGKWDVDVKKGRAKTSVRKMNNLCKSDMSESEAIKMTKKILQDFVVGKIR